MSKSSNHEHKACSLSHWQSDEETTEVSWSTQEACGYCPFVSQILPWLANQAPWIPWNLNYLNNFKAFIVSSRHTHDLPTEVKISKKPLSARWQADSCWL